MPAKNQHPYTAEGVAAYIRENAGTRYICSQLARVFHVGSEDMRETLMKLVDQGSIELVCQTRNKLYFVRTQEEKAAIQAMTPALLSARPYKQIGLAWSEVARRLAEFRAAPSVYPKLSGYNEEY